MGLDASGGGWLAVVLEGGQFAEARRARGAATLISAFPDVEAVGVDIPIGLPETPLRDADQAAREFVGPRWHSVFLTFPRVVLEAASYEDAKRICVERGWKKPSIQSWGMRHRILEIESLAVADERIVEVHPEVSFRELFGQPLSKKRDATGLAERNLALIRAGITLPDLPFPADDVYDATVAAWSAMRYAQRKALPLPEGHRDRIGAIWR